jgi:hypothetical protein
MIGCRCFMTNFPRPAALCDGVFLLFRLRRKPRTRWRFSDGHRLAVSDARPGNI